MQFNSIVKYEEHLSVTPLRRMRFDGPLGRGRTVVVVAMAEGDTNLSPSPCFSCGIERPACIV